MDLRAASSGTGWQRFLDALQEYSEAITTQCVTSSPDVLPVMQGRAQNMRTLLAYLKDAPRFVELANTRKKQT